MPCPAPGLKNCAPTPAHPASDRQAARLPALACLLLLMLGLPASRVLAQEQDAARKAAEDAAQAAAAAQFEAMRAQMETLARQVRELQQTTAELQRELSEARAAVPAGFTDPDEFYIPRLAREFEDSGLPANFGNTYTKPYLANLGKRTYLGGYIDLEYKNAEDSDQYFDQHRLVPFIYADVSERVKVSTEIEIEHGSEVEVEFAQIDYLFNEAANFRAGIQLLPLGKFNEVHDSPIQELTDRPLVDRYIIPTTLRDAGVGLYGSFSEEASYQFVVSNGFKGLLDNGANAITTSKGMRNAAPQSDDLAEPFTNINNELAYTQRVAWKPELGMEFGASSHFDTYDEAGNNALNIYALDATVDGKAMDLLPDQLELLGEAAWADIERDEFAKASGVAGDMNGWYAQANWRLDPEWLSRWKQDGTLEQDAHFTFVTRYDTVKLDTYNIERTTFGVNFRPNAHDTVFKLDYQFNSDSGSDAGLNDENAVLFSVATYF